MDEASYEHLKLPLKSDLPEQIEVRVRRERRRRWSPAEKLRIVQETLAPGAITKRVAERHDIGTGLLFTWRRQMMAGAGTGFLPVQVAPNPDMAPAAPSRPVSGGDGMIEVAMPNGVRVRAGHGVDLKVLRGVLAALDGR